MKEKDLIKKYVLNNQELTDAEIEQLAKDKEDLMSDYMQDYNEDETKDWSIVELSNTNVGTIKINLKDNAKKIAERIDSLADMIYSKASDLDIDYLSGYEYFSTIAYVCKIEFEPTFDDLFDLYE